MGLFFFIFVFVVIVFFVFVVFVGYKMVKFLRLVEDWMLKDLGFDYEDVEFIMEDGVKFSGWWVDNGSNKIVILFYGYIVSRWYFFYMKLIVEFFLKEGYNVFVFDFCVYGKSGGNYIMVGDKEFLDVKVVVEWLKKIYLERVGKIGFIGFLMGVMVIIRLFVEIEDVCCGVVDSLLMYLDKIGVRGLKYFVNFLEWFYVFVKLFMKFFSGGKEIYFIEYVDRVKKLFFIIVGEKDLFVKVEEVREFYERNRKINLDIELWVIDVFYVRIFKFYLEEWKVRVREFFNRVFNNL